MERCKEVSMLGVQCYTDAYITDTNGFLYFISIFGRPGVVKAIGAAILEGRSVEIEGVKVSRPHRPMQSLTQNLGGLSHKVILCQDYFTGSDYRILLGEDKHRAFEFLDANVSTPLKREWTDWLWEKVFHPVPLAGFGVLNGKDLSECYLVELTKSTEEVDELVLDGIRAGELN
ncbi:MAG: hypothetical protein JRJ29_20205 [Deltaproteobacteria bacterium]|nr:hypothetical protein [Deltaproteobacteria bacterium]